MTKKQKRFSKNSDKTVSPKYIRPKNDTGPKRYFIIASLTTKNDIQIELTNSHQKALTKVKDGGKVIFIKTLRDKRRINELSNDFVQKYNHQSIQVFNQLTNINI